MKFTRNDSGKLLNDIYLYAKRITFDRTSNANACLNVECKNEIKEEIERKFRLGTKVFAGGQDRLYNRIPPIID